MNKKVFKGFKQVPAYEFNAAKEANDLAGYLWFVRTEVNDGEVNDVENDIYDIYFGAKQYGHFRAGELEGIKGAIEALNGNVEDILTALGTLTGIVEANAVAISGNTEAHKANAAAISDITESMKELLVKNVDENDKVINVAQGILSAKVGISYDKDTHRISLTGQNGAEIEGFDATDFLKDSVLQNVKVDNNANGEKCLIFTWREDKDDETPETVEIPVSDFAKTYKAGSGLELTTGDTLNVKIAEAGNFLSVNGNNELIVDDMTVDKTILKESIVIKGGPLATSGVTAAFKNGIIPQGTNIQEILKALLCVEIYPTPTYSTPSYSVSAATPSIEAVGVSNGSYVEVGQAITFKAVTAKPVNVYDKVNLEVSGLVDGYSLTEKGDIIKENNIVSEWTIGQLDGHVYELSASKTNFTGSVPETVQAADASECVLSSVVLTAVEGTNKYMVTEDAPKYTGYYDGIDSVYMVSNLGGRTSDASGVTETLSGNSDVEIDPANKTATFTVTGLYPMFANGVTASTSDETAANMADLANPVTGEGTKLPLMTTGTTFAVSFANQAQEPYRLFLPGTWKVKTALAINGSTAKYSVDCKDKFVVNGTTTRTIQGKPVTYTIYEYAAKEGPNRVKFTVA